MTIFLTQKRKIGSTYKLLSIGLLVTFLSACGGGGGGNNPKPPADDPQPPSSDAYLIKNNSDAGKFLTRATFGPTKASIKQLRDYKSYDKWITAQFNLPATYHEPRVRSLATTMCANRDNNGKLLLDSWEIRYPRHHIWWEAATLSDDQLRQRVAFALSEILVISDKLGLSDYQLGVTSYYDVLVKHAFGNYRDLLEDVTLHPAMGDFLSMTRNRKANPEGTVRPDENYARELLQLFTLGVHQLNLDGTKKRDSNGDPIPTYTQANIEEFAKVFTGWSYANIDWYTWMGEGDHTKPLKAFEQYHDTTAKTLLNGEKSKANMSAREDLRFALDNIFKHPNIAPSISKQLIKRLVTSNPSPAYVKRVASKFNNNGRGVKGDMKAVIRAILLDEEALNKHPANFGKLREPLLRMSHLWRAFDMQAMQRIGHYWESHRQCGQGAYRAYNFYDALDSFSRKLGQAPLQARSVFNFFKPEFSPNGVLNENGLIAPEFQIVNENSIVSSTNTINLFIETFSTSKAKPVAIGEYSAFNLQEEAALASNSSKLLDHLNVVLLNGEMTTKLRRSIKRHLDDEELYKYSKDKPLDKAREAIMLIINSPDYLIQR